MKTYRPIVSLDGEGITYDYGEPQQYKMLISYDAASTEYRTSLGRVYSRSCFDHLLGLRPEAIKVGFGLNYDVNQWLASIPRANLEQLWYTGKCRWQEYHLDWTPGRVFRVAHIDGRKCTVWDVFGYFQCSFLEALRRWKVAEDWELEEIEDCKSQRGNFDDADLPRMERYCKLECRLLAELFARLQSDTWAVGLHPVRWDGAGSLAAHYLRVKRVKDAIKREPERLRTGVLGAYYGGRSEVAKIGEVGDCYTYDIRSAYATGIRKLPCLRHSSWNKIGATVALQLIQTEEIVLAEIEWDAGTCVYPPFPFRRLGRTRRSELKRFHESNGTKPIKLSNGGITYPENGIGWHWSNEIRAAMDVFPSMEIRVREAWHLERHCDHEPFAFIDDVYAERKSLEASGKGGMAHVLKCALAAISGKLSQSESEGKHRPTYQSFVWAGLVTAETRAAILRAIGGDPVSVVSVATDGLASVRPLPLEAGEGLGGWKHGYLRDVFIVAPGIYGATLRDGTRYVRTRGFEWRELDFDVLRREWRRLPTGTYKWTAVRFHGLGVALQVNWDGWRSWRFHPKSINAFPNTRFPHVAGLQRGPEKPMVMDCTPPRFRVPPGGELPESTPYEPRDADAWIREVEDETALDLWSHWDDGRL